MGCAFGATALLLNTLPADIDPTLGAAVKAALDAGDLALKPGQALYLHRVAGVKAARVPAASAGCCGGPATVADACCVDDQEAKAAGEAGCGCAAPALISTSQDTR